MMNHRKQVLALLRKQISNSGEVAEISETAYQVVDKWVNPVTGGREETDGLLT